MDKRASDHEIKKGYRKMAMQWHPDRHSSGTEAEKDAAEKKFKEIGEAFELLSDPEKKQRCVCVCVCVCVCYVSMCVCVLSDPEKKQRCASASGLELARAIYGKKQWAGARTSHIW